MATIAEEVPFAAAVSNEKLQTVCAKCFTQSSLKNMNRCSGCRTLRYCGSQCQKEDWVDHKEECRRLALCVNNNRVPSSMARLIGRILLKISREEHKVAAFNGRTLDQLMDHRAAIQKDAERCEFFVCICRVLYEYLGNDLLPPAAQIMSIFGKIVTNCFTIMDDDLNSLGTGLYLGLSIHDHSCQPDCFVLFQGIKALLRTPNREVKYSTELRISYTDLMQTNEVRQKELLRNYYFECSCAVCYDSSRDPLARSLRCSSCEDGVCPLDQRQMQLTCRDCGQPQKVTVDEALTKNQELEWWLQKTDKQQKGTDLRDELSEAIKVYDECAKVLSPLNISRALCCQRILSGGFQLERKDILNRYALDSVDAYKRYLPSGHPELSVRLQMAAQASATADPPNHYVLRIIEEAYESTLLSHGPRHQMTSSLDAMKAHYATKLQTFLDNC